MNAYTLKCLADRGINAGDLGCVMLDVKPHDLTGVIEPDWEYVEDHPKLGHVTGVQHEHHVTLLYGLLRNANEDRAAIDEVLCGWTPEPVRTDQLEVFPSPFPDEAPYVCIVARQSVVSRNLRDAHARLSMLPHIDTHPEYKAHVTLAYVKAEHRDDALNALRRSFRARDIYVPITFEPIGLNYGDE